MQDVTDVIIWKSSATGVASITVSGLATGLNIRTATFCDVGNGERQRNP
jgi:hypothetical protein